MKRRDVLHLPEFTALQPKAGVATSLLLLSVVMFTTSGCLLPQNDELPGFVPKNNPPRLLLNNVSPATQSSEFIIRNATCPGPQQEFSIQVADRDVSDVISNSWCVGACTSGLSGKPVVENSTEIRQAFITSPTEVLTALASKPAVPITVEVFVSDGLLAFDKATGVSSLPKTVVLPNGQTVTDQTYIDSYAWVVTPVSKCP